MKRNRPFAFVMLRLGDEERNVADWARHLGVTLGSGRKLSRCDHTNR